MASQAEIYWKKIEQYQASPACDSAVLAEMKRQYQYANSIDLSLAQKAADILNGKDGQ